jgi:FixJ family two-component response regulator
MSEAVVPGGRRVAWPAGPDEGRVDVGLDTILGWRQVDPALSTEGRQWSMARRDGRMIGVVDDDPSLRRSLRNLLMSVGFCVETFESAEAFLQSAQRDEIGCVVLDVRMAGMNGVDLLKHLVADGSRIPVIMLTAHGDDETRRQSLEAGAVAFLEKPVRSPVLLEAVRTALGTT